jgi:hypothetical protein
LTRAALCEQAQTEFCELTCSKLIFGNILNYEKVATPGIW